VIRAFRSSPTTTTLHCGVSCSGSINWTTSSTRASRHGPRPRPVPTLPLQTRRPLVVWTTMTKKNSFSKTP
jgi:hypothetical protein